MISRPFLFVKRRARAHRALPAGRGATPAVALRLRDVLVCAADVERNRRERMPLDQVRRVARVAAIERERSSNRAVEIVRVGRTQQAKQFPVVPALIHAATVVRVAVQDQGDDAR